MLKKIIAYVIMVLSVAIQFPATVSADISSVNALPITYGVSTDKTSYKINDTIKITVTATNNTNRLQTLRFNNSCRASYQIGTVFDSTTTQNCKSSVGFVILSANETIAWEFTHNLSQKPIVPGSYLLTGTVTGNGKAATTIMIENPVPPVPAPTPTPTPTPIPNPTPTPSGLTIVTTSSFDAVVNKPYTATFTAVGNDGSVVFSLSNGSLPSGLSLIRTSNTSSQITGVPNKIGAYTIELSAKDSTNHISTKTVVITVTKENSTLIALAAALPIKGAVGQPFSTTITAVGGTGPVQFTIIGGTLPPGLSLDPCSATGCTDGRTAIIKGTPTVPGAFFFNLNAKYPNANRIAQTFGITVTQ